MNVENIRFNNQLSIITEKNTIIFIFEIIMANIHQTTHQIENFVLNLKIDFIENYYFTELFTRSNVDPEYFRLDG